MTTRSFAAAAAMVFLFITSCGAQLAHRNVLWGMTPLGGRSGYGTAFWIDPANPVLTTVVDFSPEKGTGPNGSLVSGPGGRLYGVTSGGGAHGAGVLFAIDPRSGAYTVLASFSAAVGSRPLGALIVEGDGTLYGAASRGGKNDDGTVFRYRSATGRIEKAADLAEIGGRMPYGALLHASDGKLYGVTAAGGEADNGILFEYDARSGRCRRVAEFPGSGYAPYGTPIEPVSGTLFGATYNGGGTGMIYSYALSGRTFTNRMNFTFERGRSCFGSLLDGGDGKLYGLTARGASEDLGAIFAFTPETNSYVNLVDLSRALGSHPYGSLMRASDGAFYGMTFTGGNTDLGVVFRFRPGVNRYEILANFTGTNGQNPMFSHLIEAPRP